MVLLVVIFVLIGVPAAAQSPDGAALFATRCASCHQAAGESRAPAPEALKERSPESIIDALTGGAMRYQGLSLSGAERRAIAEHLTGKSSGGSVGATSHDPDAGRCTTTTAFAAAASKPQWNGWGPTPHNTHVVSRDVAGLTADDLPRLTLKWAFGFADATSAWAQPTVVDGRLFVGSQNGNVFALDAERGCILWTFEARGGVRTAISVGDGRAYFADQLGHAYAVSVETGRLIWARKVDDHPLVRLTGSPTLFDGRLYVPTSSYEEVGKAPDYPCCTFRGSIVALDARNGGEVWRTFVIQEEPRVLGKNARGIESLGPSGGAIWSAPTIDAKRRLIYAATGNTYSGTTQPATDAIVALDLRSGRIVWTKQLHGDDVFGCRVGEPNCPERAGPDYDFGASPALVTLPNGRDVVVVGQKSGIGYALDPDKQGAIRWQYRAGRGGALGGIEWGIAADGQFAYFPVADGGSSQPGGLHAVSMATGDRAWFAPPSPLLCRPGRGCNAAQSAAITVIPGAVLSGAFDGGLRAFSIADGTKLWEFDTNREFLTVNNVRARGGSLNGPAPVVVNGFIYVSSGDYRGRPGNVLLALSAR
jgi:polyvinyl alcohol dehydrogenase (cytochrome)